MTSPIVHGGLLVWLFAMLWFSQEGPQFETRHGKWPALGAACLQLHSQCTFGGCTGSVGLLHIMALLALSTNVLYSFGGLLLNYNPLFPTTLMLTCTFTGCETTCSGSLWVSARVAVSWFSGCVRG